MNKNESKYFNTAKKMGDSLVSLLDIKDFEYVTIKDICKKANVNRSTFYLHYENTYDLLTEVISNMNSSFSEYFENNKANLSSENAEDLFLIKDEYLLPYLQFVKKNKNVYKAVNNQSSLFRADESYNEMYRTVFSPILSRYGVDEEAKPYLMSFYMKGLVAIIMTWVNDDCLMDEKKIIEIIKTCIQLN